MVMIVNNVVYLKISKKVDLKSSHHKKKKSIIMCGDRS